MMKFFAICLSIFNVVYKGFIMKTFWAWFVLTTFPHLPRIETVAAIGLALFINAASPWKSTSTKDIEGYMAVKDSKFTPYIGLINSAGHFAGASLLLGVGWLFHHFFM